MFVPIVFYWLIYFSYSLSLSSLYFIRIVEGHGLKPKGKRATRYTYNMRFNGRYSIFRFLFILFILFGFITSSFFLYLMVTHEKSEQTEKYLRKWAKDVVQCHSVLKQSELGGRNINFFLQLEMCKNVVTFNQLLHKSETLKQIHKCIQNSKPFAT